ncbi:outer dense fiber protein 2-like isoform X2 [Amphiura filiformis]|uniref:outer dense fiber protein 2-like isoform X2 n=1 Tax=Amphiura filiformis TaxID=82378 RepID=UPI003B20CF6E
MMTIEKGRGKPDPNSPPIHVHVDQQTPVHVHIKKPAAQKKSATARAVEERLRKVKAAKLASSHSFGAGNLRPTASVREPWVPAPAKSTRGKKFGWQSSSHSLCIEPPDHVHSTLRMEDLHHDEDFSDDGRFQQYEKKIDSLMTQVGSLKSQRDLERTRRVADKTKDELNVSKKVIENQEEELNEFREELEMTERENKHLRRSVDRLKDETDYAKTEKVMEHREHGQLMKKMVEAELDADAAAQQVTALRDVCHRLKEDKRVSSHDAKVLTKQRDLLLQKLEDFEDTNSTLKQMLREQHRVEASKGHTEEQRDVLLKKLTESDATNQKLRVAIMERNHEVDSMKTMLDAEREQSKSMAELHTSIESTRAHLQNQLRKREGDCNRMAVQIRKLENQVAQERIEVEHLQDLLQSAKEKAMADKDALKKATRAQKERATRSEDTVDKLNSQLVEVETLLAENRTAVDQLKSKHEKVSREKNQLEGDNTALSRRIEELEVRFRESELNSRIEVDEVKVKLHNKTSEASTVKLENDKLKATLATVQDKLTFAESEIGQLKSSLHEYENLVSDYKAQPSLHASHLSHCRPSGPTHMNRSRRETLDVSMRLEQNEHEKSRLQQDSHAALEDVREKLELRLKELEPLPGMLHNTEKQLLEATEKLMAQERRSTDQAGVIGDLTKKVQHQTDQMESFREKWHATQDDARALKAQLEVLQRRLKETEDENRELHGGMAKREESIHQNQMRLEEKTRENSSLTRQLEQSIADTRRLEEEAREKAMQRERNSQARILDLESQLSRNKTEVLQIKRQKEDAERKFNSQLYDLKDRLEQSHSTNRSMQNYVQFLKNSYSNVFGDTSFSASPYKSRHSPLH